jgi:hypothetical protein
MKDSGIKVVDMVREIRDRLYERTKDMSASELQSFFHREAAATRKQLEDLASTQPSRD